MKRHGWVWVMLCTLLILIGCTSTHTSPANDNTLKESWMTKLNTNPARWTRHADSWFFTNDPTAQPKTQSIMTVNVAPFTKINVSGTFPVQIAGQQSSNSLAIMGSRASARLVEVTVVNHTLYVRQAANCPAVLNNIIVRIGVNNLKQLTYAGSGDVTARNITSNGLAIHSYGSGTVLLDGQTRLTNVTQNGTGSVIVLNTQTPHVDVADMSSGNVYISGRVGINHLVHCGSGIVSIIGADSSDLCVDANSGLTTVVGYVNLRKLNVQKDSRVYIYWVASTSAYVNARDQSCVGLAGSAQTVNINITGKSQLAGQYLHGCDVYIHTYDTTRATISVRGKMFAAAEDKSIIYYFGSPTLVTQYIKQQGVIIPMRTSLPVP